MPIYSVFWFNEKTQRIYSCFSEGDRISPTSKLKISKGKLPPKFEHNFSTQQEPYLTPRSKLNKNQCQFSSCLKVILKKEKNINCTHILKRNMLLINFNPKRNSKPRFFFFWLKTYQVSLQITKKFKNRRSLKQQNLE